MSARRFQSLDLVEAFAFDESPGEPEDEDSPLPELFALAPSPEPELSDPPELSDLEESDSPPSLPDDEAAEEPFLP